MIGVYLLLGYDENDMILIIMSSCFVYAFCCVM